MVQNNIHHRGHHRRTHSNNCAHHQHHHAHTADPWARIATVRRLLLPCVCGGALLVMAMSVYHGIDLLVTTAIVDPNAVAGVREEPQDSFLAGTTLGSLLSLSKSLMPMSKSGMLNNTINRDCSALATPTTTERHWGRSSNDHSSVLQQRRKRQRPLAVMCAIIKDEEVYLDEWVDYHLALGFHHIYLYDNNAESLIMQYYRRKDVTIIRFVPDRPDRQRFAYQTCAKRLKAQPSPPKYVAFYDPDEFLVLKQHDHVVDLLEDYLPEGGSLSINWYLFGTGNHTFFQPLPVTARFVYREAACNLHIKSIVRLTDMNVAQRPHAHYPVLVAGKQQWDTHRNTHTGPYLPDGPTNVAVLHHMHTKSVAEYVRKRLKGKAGYNESAAAVQTQLESVQRGEILRGDVFDDAAWQQLQRLVPAYRGYNAIMAAGLYPQRF